MFPWRLFCLPFPGQPRSSFFIIVVASIIVLQLSDSGEPKGIESRLQRDLSNLEGG